MVINHLHPIKIKGVLCTKQAFNLTTFNCFLFLIHQQFRKYFEYYYEILYIIFYLGDW